MHLFSVEHSKAAYLFDYVLYGIAALALASLLCLAPPDAPRLEMGALALLGLSGWSLMEYLLHRFVLHGLRPFSTWHAEHHFRPSALICAPTWLSATLIATLIFIPALLVGGFWRANALTFGLLCGYLAYAIAHHATHHWRSRSGWLRDRKRWHALHHAASLNCSHYGVTTSLWDYLLGTAPPQHLARPLPSIRRQPGNVYEIHKQRKDQKP